MIAEAIANSLPTGNANKFNNDPVARRRVAHESDNCLRDLDKK
jgi:hypothetical protein